MDITKRQIANGIDEEPRRGRDLSRRSVFEAMRRSAARRAKLAAHFAFLNDADIDELFACIEAGITAAPAELSREWR